MSKIVSVSDKYSNGLAYYQDDRGLYGFVDENNNIVIKAKFKEVKPFCNGVAVVKNIFNDSYLIDTNGKRVFLDNYEPKDIKIIEVRKFSEGYAAIKDENNLWGFIDENGEIVIKPEYREVGDFKNGVAIVNQRNYKYTIIDKNNKRLTKKDYAFINDFIDHYAVVGEYRITVEVFEDFKEMYSYGVIDENGNEILSCEYDEVLPPYKNVLVAGKHNRERYIGYIVFNTKLNTKTHVNADKVYPFNNGYATCKLDNKYAIFDEKGKNLVFKFKYGYNECSFFEFDHINEICYGDDIFHIVEVTNPDNVNEFYIFLAKNKEIIYGPILDSKLYRETRIYPNKNGTFNICKEEYGRVKVGLIDKDGKLIIPTVTREAEMLENNLAYFKTHHMYFVPRNGVNNNSSFEPYSKVEGLEGSFAAIAKYEGGNKNVYLDENGKELFDGLKFDLVSYFHDGYAVCRNKIIDTESNDPYEYYEYYILDEKGIQFTLPNDEINNIEYVKQIKGPVFEVRLNDKETSYLINAKNHKIVKIKCDKVTHDNGLIIVNVLFSPKDESCEQFDVLYNMDLDIYDVPYVLSDRKISVLSDELIAIKISDEIRIYNINTKHSSKYLEYRQFVKVDRISLNLTQEERRRKGYY